VGREGRWPSVKTSGCLGTMGESAGQEAEGKGWYEKTRERCRSSHTLSGRLHTRGRGQPASLSHHTGREGRRVLTDALAHLPQAYTTTKSSHKK
jgi:hypothetical protein